MQNEMFVVQVTPPILRRDDTRKQNTPVSGEERVRVLLYTFFKLSMFTRGVLLVTKKPVRLDQ